jgi:hypothetical protein
MVPAAAAAVVARHRRADRERACGHQQGGEAQHQASHDDDLSQTLSSVEPNIAEVR